MEKFKFSLHELVTVGAVFVSVAGAYTLLQSDVSTLKSDVKEMNTEVTAVRTTVNNIKIEQFRMAVMLDYMYNGTNTREQLTPHTKPRLQKDEVPQRFKSSMPELALNGNYGE